MTVLRPAGDIGELDGADEINEFAEAVFVEVGAADRKSVV